MNSAQFLIALADALDNEGKYELADVIDEDFEELVKLIEQGKFNFETEFSGGSRDPRGPYSNFGVGVPLCAIPGPQ
jgi:hypothetical protein